MSVARGHLPAIVRTRADVTLVFLVARGYHPLPATGLVAPPEAGLHSLRHPPIPYVSASPLESGAAAGTVRSHGRERRAVREGQRRAVERSAPLLHAAVRQGVPQEVDDHVAIAA